jgi:hypothetical protein
MLAALDRCAVKQSGLQPSDLRRCAAEAEMSMPSSHPCTLTLHQAGTCAAVPPTPR